jgi:hypothetical protein
MKRFLYLLISVALINSPFFFSEFTLSERPDLHHYVSKIHLTDAQRKEIIYAGDQGIEVYRYRTSDRLWSVAVGKIPRGAFHAIRIGTLFKEPLVGEINTPVYLCAYLGFKGETISLDSNPNCSGDGLILSKTPVGYVSAKVRSGYAALIRCSDSENGVYLTFDQRCEKRSDHVHGLLGTILVSQ